MPETVNADMSAFRGFNSKFRHCPMHAGPHDVIGQEGLIFAIDEEIAFWIRFVVFGEPIVQVFGKQVGHADRRGARATLRSAFLPRGIVQGCGDVNELPLEVEATDFQGGNFAYAEAGHGGDEEREFIGIHRGIDNLRGSVSIEEKDLRLGFLVGGEHNVLLFDVRDCVTPLSA